MTNSEQLRALADFCDAYPALTKSLPINNTIYISDDNDLILKFAKLPGARKLFSDVIITIKVPIDTTSLESAQLHLEIMTARANVCTPTKFETIECQALPAYTYEKPVEWDCHPLLASVKDVE